MRTRLLHRLAAVVITVILGGCLAATLVRYAPGFGIDERELDVIASTGEQVTVGLLALAIQAEGGRATSLLG